MMLAKSIQVYKSGDIKKIANNCRSISVLPFFNIEKVVYNRTMNFVYQTQLYK